jgi:hypothetical protein
MKFFTETPPNTLPLNPFLHFSVPVSIFPANIYGAPVMHLRHSSHRRSLALHLNVTMLSTVMPAPTFVGLNLDNKG